MNINDLYKTPLDDDFNKFSTLWEALLDEWEKLSEQIPDAKHAYEMAYAQSIKKEVGTAQFKDSEATLATKKEYLTLLKAEARLEFIKAKIKWADKELDILRTRAANARMEFNQSNLPERRN